MNTLIGLDKLAPGERGVIKQLHTFGGMRRRFLDIGLTQNTVVECVGCSPGGDPSAYLIRGAVIAIRACDSRNIKVLRYREGSAWG